MTSWNKLRKEVIKRDCRGLLFSLIGTKGMEVHHIKPRSEGGKDVMSNLVAVGPHSHKTIHALERKGITERRRLRKLKGGGWF